MGLPDLPIVFRDCPTRSRPRRQFRPAPASPVNYPLFRVLHPWSQVCGHRFRRHRDCLERHRVCQAQLRDCREPRQDFPGISRVCREINQAFLAMNRDCPVEPRLPEALLFPANQVPRNRLLRRHRHRPVSRNRFGGKRSFASDSGGPRVRRFFYLVPADWTPLVCPRYAHSVRHRLATVCGVLLGLGLFLAGCREKHFETPTAGTYGAATNVPSLNLSRQSPNELARQPWTNGELAVIQTELSPALLLHCRSTTLSLFAQMRESGLGGPTFAAISTQQGPKIFKPGERIEPARMRESWFVVWFAGANGWTNWDSPWFVTLQHRPTKIHFDTNGLHFTFPDAAGYTALMPLYG